MLVRGLGRNAQKVRSALKVLLPAALADLAALVIVIVAHAATGSPAFLPVALFLTAMLAVVSASALFFGGWYLYASQPGARRPMLFVCALTLATLLAHLYIINAPPAGTSGTVSGTAGGTFHDDYLTVDSAVTGQVLKLNITATGGAAIGALNVSVDSYPAPASGFRTLPSFSRPLQPGQVATGTWALQSQVSKVQVSYQYLSCYDTGKKTYGCIMDESYYVPEAQGMLAGQHCSPNGTNCHMEHPFLSPALIAAGMALFGEFDTLGWRIMPALLGTLCIPIVFGIAWKLAEDKRLAYLSATLLGLDVMFFSQSSAALLDVPEVFFGLLAVFVYVWDLRLRKLDKNVLAGAMLGLAGLSKETAIFIALALFTYVLVFGKGSKSERYLSTLKIAFALVVVFSVGLQTYDSLLATPAVPHFTDQVNYMITYGSGLQAKQLACQPTTGYWCKFPSDPGGPPILPTDWLLYYVPVAYYATSVSVCPNSVNGVCQGGQYSYVQVAYYGVTNLIETWTTFVWAPLVAWVLYKHFRRRQVSLEEFGFQGSGPGAGASGDLKFAGLALIWFVWNYFSFVALFLGQRVTYPFYFVPAIPAVAMGASYLLTRKGIPRWLVLAFVLLVFVFFLVYFPYKAFLPEWLRAAIDR